MKKLLTLAITSGAILALAAGALAQPDDGDLGIFFDSAGTMTSRSAAQFQPIDIFVLSFNPDAGQEGYEFKVADIPGASFIGEAVYPCNLLGGAGVGWDDPNTAQEGLECDGANAGPATNFGSGSRNYLVGTGAVCWGLNPGENVLVQLQILFTTAPGDDIEVMLEPATPSSFTPARPGYLACQSPGDLRLLNPAYEGAAVLNPVNITPPVAIEASTWGAIKAKF